MNEKTSDKRQRQLRLTKTMSRWLVGSYLEMNSSNVSVGDCDHDNVDANKDDWNSDEELQSF